jgi:predicted nucleic acid-binding protein
LITSSELGGRQQRWLRRVPISLLVAYLVEWWPGAIATAVKVAERYVDTGLGLADGSAVALAERLDTIDIATLDERHFRAVRPLAGGKAFGLLPADA